MAETRKQRQRRALARQRKRIGRRNALNKIIARVRVRIIRRWKLLQTPGAGARAVKRALSMVGKVETGYNDAPWLRQMEREILSAGIALDWMIPGQPYCGFGMVWAWLPDKKLPAGTVYTPNICAGQGYGRKVSASQAKPGDLVVFHFGVGGAKHVGMALGPASGGSIKCVEFNTSPGNGGSQANGGGCWIRTRPLYHVQCVTRP